MDVDLSSLEPLEGGWSGRTFLARAAGERCVVRIYPPDEAKGPHAAEIDASVMRLARGLVPVPDMLEVRSAIPEADLPGLLVTSWCEGIRGDLALEQLDAGAKERMGESMGMIAATMAGIATLQPGAFTDSSLALRPFGMGLEEWLEDHAGALVDWTPEDLAGLSEVAGRAQHVLDAAARSCLVHSDLNPKNVLVNALGDVVGVVDWEWAHSGHPFTDLGNVVRFDRDPAYEQSALAGYVGLRGGQVAQARDSARAADLWALIELAARSGRTPVVLRADRLLREIAASGDWDAWPSSW